MSIRLQSNKWLVVNLKFVTAIALLSNTGTGGWASFYSELNYLIIFFVAEYSGKIDFYSDEGGLLKQYYLRTDAVNNL